MARATSDMLQAAKEGIEARAEASGDSIKAITERELSASRATAERHAAHVGADWKPYKKIAKDTPPGAPGWSPHKKADPAEKPVRTTSRCLRTP